MTEDQIERVCILLEQKAKEARYRAGQLARSITPEYLALLNKERKKKISYKPSVKRAVELEAANAIANADAFDAAIVALKEKR